MIANNPSPEKIATKNIVPAVIIDLRLLQKHREEHDRGGRKEH